MLIKLFALFAVGLACTSSADAQRNRREGRLEVKPCTITGIQHAVECGTYSVLENRANAAGLKIGIRILRLPATGTHHLPDPVFIFVGGPGEAATSAAAGIAEGLKSLNATRDVVLVDSRGAGGSNALSCKLPGSAEFYFNSRFAPGFISRCRSEVETHADLKQYTYLNAIDDLDQLRNALGYQHFNAIGFSYGTREVLGYVRRFPGVIRSAVLIAVVPPDFRAPLPFARAEDDALAKLNRDCLQDQTCTTAFPHFEQELRSLAQHLQREPANVTFLNPEGGQPITATITTSGFVEDIRTLLYSPETAAKIPLMIHEAYKGTWSVFANQAAKVIHDSFQGASFGLFMSTTCAEDVAFITEHDTVVATRDTFAGDSRVQQQIRACALWPIAKVPSSYTAPVRSSTPSLILSGEADPAIPQKVSDAQLRNLTNATQVIFPHAGHGIEPDPCSISLMTQFIQDPVGAHLDSHCAQQNVRPAFATHE